MLMLSTKVVESINPSSVQLVAGMNITLLVGSSAPLLAPAMIWRVFPVPYSRGKDYGGRVGADGGELVPVPVDDAGDMAEGISEL